MKIFIDTAPFIYLIENNPNFVEKVRNFLIDAISNHYPLTTSVITIMEFGVMPEKKGRQDIILKFESFLKAINVSVIPVDEKASVTAYKLRAKYDFLKSMDALQIAVALEENCHQFLTNDKKLNKITELEVIVLEDL